MSTHNTSGTGLKIKKLFGSLDQNLVEKQETTNSTRKACKEEKVISQNKELKKTCTLRSRGTSTHTSITTILMMKPVGETYIKETQAWDIHKQYSMYLIRVRALWSQQLSRETQIQHLKMTIQVSIIRCRLLNLEIEILKMLRRENESITKLWNSNKRISRRFKLHSKREWVWWIKEINSILLDDRWLKCMKRQEIWITHMNGSQVWKLVNLLLIKVSFLLEVWKTLP